MTCQDIYDFLDAPASRETAPLPPTVLEHCAHCDRCCALIDLFRLGLPREEVPGEVQSRVEKAVVRTLTPVIPLPGSGRLTLRFVITFTAVCLLGILLMGAGGWRAAAGASFAVIVLVLAANAISLSHVLSGLMAPGSRRIWNPGAVLLGVAIALPLALAMLLPWQMGRPFLTPGLRCAMAGFLLTAPAGVSIWALARRGAILSPGLAGASIGLLAGLAGALVLHFGCMIIKAPHVLVWHASVPIVSAVLGFLLGRFSPGATT